jgi:hypothetical protein
VIDPQRISLKGCGQKNAVSNHACLVQSNV